MSFRVTSRSRRPGAKLERGCLALFALPFAGVGIGSLAWLVSTLLRIAAAQSWVETPAQILEARLVGGETHRAEARYAYVYEGRRYEGDRVSFYGGSDNIGSFQRDAHEELSRHVSAAAPESVEADPGLAAGPLFRCYVNPKDPAESVLYRNVRPAMLGFQLLFALLFGGVGFGLLIGGLVAGRSAKRRNQRVEQFPNEPWKWRDDWAGGLLRAERKSTQFILLFALFWNAVSFPIAFFALPDVIRQGNHAGLLILIFPVVGVGLGIWAVRDLLRLRRFGDATLQLATIPGVIGGKLAGVVQLPTKIRAEGGFHLKLKCACTVTSGSGKHRRTDEQLLWEEEQVIATDALKDPNRTALPVLFAIPFDQPPTDPEAAAPVAWRLEVTARIPGVDLAVHFDLPVFRTDESSPDFQLDASPIQPYLAPLDPEVELRGAGVRIEQTSRGTAFVFPPARFVGQAIFLTLFAAIWTGAIVFMFAARARGNGPPLFFPIIFGFFDLLILWGLLDAWIGCGRIEADRSTLRWKKGLFGGGAWSDLPSDQIAGISAEPASRSGSVLRYNVAVTRRDGARETISREMPSKRAAETLIAELQRTLAVSGTRAPV